MDICLIEANLTIKPTEGAAFTLTVCVSGALLQRLYATLADHKTDYSLLPFSISNETAATIIMEHTQGLITEDRIGYGTMLPHMDEEPEQVPVARTPYPGLDTFRTP